MTRDSMIGIMDSLKMFSENYFKAEDMNKNCADGKPTSFTNFSIKAILKPDFGSRYSEEEEEMDADRSSISPAETDYSISSSPSERSDMYSSEHALNFFQRFQQRYYEDDVSSASSSPYSSDNESALDLRISRKKTPPKLEIPAWVFCTRYSDRPSAGPRSRRKKTKGPARKRPRTAFDANQLHQLRLEFEESPYLSEPRRQELAERLGLNESQVKIWFQNKRATLKKHCGPQPLAVHLRAQGLYNHKTRASDNETDNCYSDSEVSCSSVHV